MPRQSVIGTPSLSHHQVGRRHVEKRRPTGRQARISPSLAERSSASASGQSQGLDASQPVKTGQNAYECGCGQVFDLVPLKCITTCVPRAAASILSKGYS